MKLVVQPGIVTSRTNGLPFGAFLLAPGFTPNGTHFVNFEPQCASMRAGFASDYYPSGPHASADYSPGI